MGYQLKEGQSYTIGIAVTNSSTKSGQPAAATLKVAVSASAGGAAILATQQQSYNFAAGESHEFQFPMTVPSGTGGQSGAINAALLDPSGSQLQQASADIQIATVAFSLTAINLSGDGLWDGKITDVATGASQSWGIQSVLTPAVLNPTFGNLVLLDYTTQNDNIHYGPYLIELTSNAGEFVWDGSAKTLNGITSVELAATNNHQRLKGTLAFQLLLTGVAYIPRVMINVTDSVATPGKVNVGQYFIGRTVTIEVAPPLNQNGQYSLATGDLVECECVFAKNFLGLSYLSGFKGESIRKAGQYPDSAYSFSASGSADASLCKFNITVTGAVSPFRIAIVGKVASYEIYNLIGYEQGPVYNGVWDYRQPYSYYGFTGYTCTLNGGNYSELRVYAHPDPTAVWDVNYAVNRWQLVKVFRLWP